MKREKNGSKSELGKDEVKRGMKTKIFEIKRMLRQQGDLIKPLRRAGRKMSVLKVQQWGWSVFKGKDCGT